VSHFARTPNASLSKVTECIPEPAAGIDDQASRANPAARSGGVLVSATVHGAPSVARVSSVTSSAESAFISAARWLSSGKPISTQPTSTGAFTGTSTTW